jgi:SAM-dependent methyltransferase
MAKALRKTWSTPVVLEEKRLIPCTLCSSTSFKPSLSCEGFSYVRCVDCSLVQMNPQPLELEVKRRYGAMPPLAPAGAVSNPPLSLPAQSVGGKDYLYYELANEDAFLDLELLALADAGFDELETGRFLDIGCATGSLLVKLREEGWETVGVEICAPQAEYGRQKRNLDIRSLSLEENSFPACHFDVVHASHLIEHVNNPGAMLREVYRILKPGGRFFVTTPNIAGFQSRLFGSRWRSAIFDHLYLFSEATLSRLLKESGFSIEKISTWGGLAAGIAPAPVKRLFDKAAKRFGFGDVMVLRTIKGTGDQELGVGV